MVSSVAYFPKAFKGAINGHSSLGQKTTVGTNDRQTEKEEIFKKDT